MAKYYAAVAGLPNIAVEDRKLPFDSREFVAELDELLTTSDRKLLHLLLLEEENKYLLTFLTDKDAALKDEDTPALFSYTQLDEIVEAYQTEDKLPRHKAVPAYFHDFVLGYLGIESEDEKRTSIAGVSHEDKLAALYYAYALNRGNQFLEEWFRLNLNIKNILAANTSAKLGWDARLYVVGEGEVEDKLRTSKARDFGIGDEIPYLNEVLRIADEKDITRRERQLDLLKWDWLEEQTFRKTFDVDSLLAYYLKLRIIERWVSLDEKTGEQTFRQIVRTLKQESTDSLETFKRNQKK